MDIKNPQNLKKALAIVSTSTLLAAFGTPSVVPVLKPAVVQAAGAEVSTVTSVPSIKDTAEKQELATIRIKFTAGTIIKENDFVIVDLPEDFTFASSVGTDVYDKNRVTVSGKDFTGGKYREKTAAELFELEDGAEGSDRVIIRAKSTIEFEEDAYLYIYLGEINVNGAKGGPANVELTTASSVSAFPQGKVTVANVVGTGEVQLSVVKDATSNDNFTVKIRVKEEIAGSLKSGDKSLKFTLPDGFEWNSVTDQVYTPIANGDDDIEFKVDKDELQVKVTDKSGVTDLPSIYEFTLKFHVSDESKAKPGDVVVKVSGDSNVNVSQLVVGKYGQYGVKANVSEVKTLYAGQDDQKLGDITIEELIKGSLVQDRTITLTLPEGARWQKEFEANVEGDTDLEKEESWTLEQSGGLEVEFVGYTGTDKRTAKFTVKRASSSNEGKIKLKDVKIAVAPNYTGPIEIEIGGTAGASGKVKVADVVSPVDVKVENLRNVIIGAADQIAGDLVITEKEDGVLSDDKDLLIELPSGVKFVGTPKVEVTSGDLRIGTVRVQKGDNGSDSVLAIRIENDSTEASTIRISNIRLNLDRTVAEGSLDVEIKGAAVLTTDAYEDWEGIDYVAKVAIANVVTPAPSDQKATVVFTVDDTKYTVNGVEKTADVAPYIKDGRTFLPVRYVAEAIGVSSDNILWDAATKTVTLFKGDRVVKLKIGSKVMYVNGTAINMDVAPEIKDGRTMLPLRWVGTALGVTVEWDEEARTVTVKQ